MRPTTGVRRGRSRTRRATAASTAANNANAAAATASPSPPAPYPSVGTARRLAVLAAELPGADRRRQHDRLAVIDTLCDGSGWPDSVRSALILRECVAWPAVTDHVARARAGRGPARALAKMGADELAAILELDRGLAVAERVAWAAG